MTEPHYIYVERESNNLGVAGFTLSILGYLTCGVLCVPAMFMCMVALSYPNRPKGLAIAGFMISIPGVLMVVLFCIGSALPYFVELRRWVREQNEIQSVERLESEGKK